MQVTDYIKGSSGRLDVPKMGVWHRLRTPPKTRTLALYLGMDLELARCRNPSDVPTRQDGLYSLDHLGTVRESDAPSAAAEEEDLPRAAPATAPNCDFAVRGLHRTYPSAHLSARRRASSQPGSGRYSRLVCETCSSVETAPSICAPARGATEEAPAVCYSASAIGNSTPPIGSPTRLCG